MKPRPTTAGPRRTVWRIVWLLVATGLPLFACSSPPPPPPFTPVADNKLLMQSVVDPAADVIWESVGTIVTKEGTEERRPKDAKEWDAIRNSAVALAESGNLLMMLPRAKDGGEWMKASKALVDTGTAAMRAAEARNAERLFTVGGDIYDACTNCHMKYMEAITNAPK